MAAPIGWYVHHQGRGHLTRARLVAGVLGRPVTVLSSLPEPSEPGPFTGWLRLPPDWDPPVTGRTADPTARGMLHWVPRRHPGLRARMAAISDWIARHRPAALVVDVSVEVAALARLHGIPVVAMVLPGVRDDGPHRWVHAIADALLAPWPEQYYDTAYLAEYRDRLHCVGGLSRYTGRARTGDPEPGRVLLLGGTGGTDPSGPDQPWQRAAGPGRWHWQLLGGTGSWLADPWPELCRAEVVVCQTGQNAVADAGAAGARIVAVPQQRPFAEQQATARALVSAGLAVGADARGVGSCSAGAVPGWPEPDAWPELLEQAARLRPDWSRWRLAGAAERAAAVIAGVADD